MGEDDTKRVLQLRKGVYILTEDMVVIDPKHPFSSVEAADLARQSMEHANKLAILIIFDNFAWGE